MAKKSRRLRKQEAEKRSLQQTPEATPAPAEEAIDTSVSEAKETASVSTASSAAAVNFADEYYYVYTELRNILVVAIVMFAILFGLGYFI